MAPPHHWGCHTGSCRWTFRCGGCWDCRPLGGQYSACEMTLSSGNILALLTHLVHSSCVCHVVNRCFVDLIVSCALPGLVLSLCLILPCLSHCVNIPLCVPYCLGSNLPTFTHHVLPELRLLFAYGPFKGWVCSLSKKCRLSPSCHRDARAILT